MAWRIRSWTAVTGCGEIVSPHLGPWPFGPEQNLSGVTDFAPGEPVVVELDATPTGYAVRWVVPACARQPAGTELPGLVALAGSDLRLDERIDDRLVFWAGDCCEHCSPSAPNVVFAGVASVLGFDGDIGDVIDRALVRRATEHEVAELGLAVAPGKTAYCVVTQHGQGRDGPSIFIIASSAEVDRGS